MENFADRHCFCPPPLKSLALLTAISTLSFLVLIPTLSGFQME